MASKIGINGFGRIGRLVVRAAIENKNANIMAINDPFMTPSYMAYLLKYDTAHGTFKFPIQLKEKEKQLIVGDKKIQLFFEKDPTKIPWKSAAVDYVAECSGAFTN